MSDRGTIYIFIPVPVNASAEASGVPLSSSLSVEDQDEDDFPFEDAYEARIDRHNVHRKTSEVSFKVKWRFRPSGPWFRAWYEEEDVQHRLPDMVLEYWKGLGGRCQATKLKNYRVFKILSEDNELDRYQIQWTGYDADRDTTMEPKKKIKDICPGEVHQWECRKQE
ncbi:hypothetical protein F66182_5247 [Fusarium sp. NRRL 66182]|nr:hypothetical protein F66182_5247 [Fusarium sp. NRRL 66182]